MRLKRTILSLAMTLAVLAVLIGGGLPVMADGTLVTISGLPEYDVEGIWGTAADDFYVAGDDGWIYHYQAGAWTQMTNANTSDLMAIWGTGTDNIFATGKSSTILHYDGSTWETQSNEGDSFIRDIHGPDGDTAFVVGNSGIIQRYQSGVWSTIYTHSTIVYGVWAASADELFAATRDATVLHYKDGTWTEYSGICGYDNTVYKIWGTDANNVYAVCSDAIVLHWDGTSWSEEVHGLTTESSKDIWGSGPDDIFVACADGHVLHYTGEEEGWSLITTGTDENNYSVWGDGLGTAYFGSKDGVLYQYNYTPSGMPIAVDIRATGLNGEVITLAEDYEVPAVEVTEDGCTYDAQTALGAVTYYCQQEGITIDVQTMQGFIMPLQIGDDTADNVLWQFFLNHEEPADPPAVQTLSDGDYVHFYNSSIPDTTIDLRATGTSGDIFATYNYTVSFGTVAEDGYIMDSQTAMGALVTYCQENSIDVTVTESSYGLYVYQIGTDTGDEDSWVYYADGVTPWVSGDQYALTDGEAIHWANYLLGLYSLTLSLDVTEIDPGDTVTATVTYTDGDGVAAVGEAADVYVSDTTDSYGYPATPGTSVGQTDTNGELAFTWSDSGTYYPYAEYNGLDTVYQYPVVTFTCTGSTTPAWDVNGDGSINVFDMGLVGVHFGETGEAGWIPEDINSDGVINVFDMGIIGVHFGE